MDPRYRYLAETIGVELLVVPIAFPLTGDEDIMDPVREALQVNGTRVAVAVFSHIASMPVVLNPVQKLVALCHSQNRRIPVIIDGAHAPGQILVDVSAIGAEVYIGDLHKWMFSPKGSAFIYVGSNATTAAGRHLHDALQPTTTTSDLSTGTMASRFHYVGTRDYTAYCAVNDAFKFREQFGDLNIMNYIFDLARRGGELIARTWGSFTLVPTSMQPGMTNPVLPCRTPAACNYLSSNLTGVEDIWMSGDQLPSPGQYPSQFCGTKNGLMVYWRLSAQIYLELSDFERLAKGGFYCFETCPLLKLDD